MELHYPVLDCLPELRLQLQKYPVVILQAPPGAGKSTIVPLELINHPALCGKKIVMLEPRRLAARAVAMRMASLLNEEIGEQVGYRIRFESRAGKKTVVEVVTEGILTRMLQTDNALSEVGLAIFDEFHERSLNADLALALCLQVQNILRPDLRILIMSATVDAQMLSSQLNNAPVVSSAGKTHPVEVVYLGDDRGTSLPVRMHQAIRLAVKENSGDILCFLPGTGEIKRTAQLLDDELSAVVVPLYGDLPFTAQQKAIMPDEQGRRKIVLATSIAETSLTIEGITTVIDSGYARVPRFDPRSGLTRLETVQVTKDAAAQRTGRAGRLGPGVCYRLWSEAVHRHLAEERKPEILEVDLASMLLELLAWGTHNPTDLKWITPPPIGAISQATDLLIQLGALHQNRITSLGKKMVVLPTHPRIAHMLVAVESYSNLVALAADVAAILEERDPLLNKTSADLSLRVEVLRRWRSGNRVMAEESVLERIERLARAWRTNFSINWDNTPVPDDAIGKLLALAYPERIAQRLEKHGERYKLANGRVARLPSHDPLMHSEWIAVAQVDAGTSEGKIFLAAPLHENDLVQLATPVKVVRWDGHRGMVEGVEEMRIGNLVLSKKPLNEIADNRRVEVICKAVQDEGLKLLNWQESHTLWQNRVLSLRAWRPIENWPDVSHDQLMKSVEDWLNPFLTGVNNRQDLQRLNLQTILDGLIPWELYEKLNTLAPPRLEVPSGSMIQVNYFSDGQPPVMEVRLQEVFGLPDTPTVNEGRIKITMHLLSPGYKPVQVTQDLKSFWNSTYHEVKKELKRRYPKHSWPDDPWTAKAVRGVVKRKPV
jgi:ATP-dependent helicase HrpB